MSTTRRTRSHTQRQAAITSVRAHLDGPNPDSAVREAYDKHLSESLPAYQAAVTEHNEFDADRQEPSVQDLGAVRGAIGLGLGLEGYPGTLRRSWRQT